MNNTLVSIQVIPTVPVGEDLYEFVDGAINIIDEAGVKYEGNPLDTVMEGDLQQLLHIVEKVNQFLVDKGAEKVMSQIKILHDPQGVSGAKITEKYR